MQTSTPARPKPTDSLPDRLASAPLAVERIGAAALRAEGRQEYCRLDTIAPQWLVKRLVGDYILRLCYRRHASDMTWLQLDVDPEQYSVDWNYLETQLETANLDGRGQPEVLVSLQATTFANGGDLYEQYAYLLDVTPPQPRLLLRARTGDVQKASIAYLKMHGDTITEAQAYSGCTRHISLRGQEVVVDSVCSMSGEACSDAELLTRLKIGRYRYQDGHLTWNGR